MHIYFLVWGFRSRLSKVRIRDLKHLWRFIANKKSVQRQDPLWWLAITKHPAAFVSRLKGLYPTLARQQRKAWRANLPPAFQHLPLTYQTCPNTAQTRFVQQTAALPCGLSCRPCPDVSRAAAGCSHLPHQKGTLLLYKKRICRAACSNGCCHTGPRWAPVLSFSTDCPGLAPSSRQLPPLYAQSPQPPLKAVVHSGWFWFCFLMHFLAGRLQTDPGWWTALPWDPSLN